MNMILRVYKFCRFLPLIFLSIIVIGCSFLDSSSTDEEVLQELREAGSDFSRLHTFDFYLYHPDEMGATDICGELESEGFQITVREGALEGEWLCLASTSMLPSIEKLAEFELLFEGLIGLYGGEYDGWETIVIPE
jgi:hypothetical protein